MQQRFVFLLFFLFLGLAITASAAWWPFGEHERIKPVAKPLTAPPSAEALPKDGRSLLQQPAPAYRFAHQTAPGQSSTPADWHGKPVFLNFFASWCVPCRAEHPVITELRRKTSAPVIGVGHMDRVEDTQKLLAAHGNPYTLVLEDKFGKGGKAWGVRGVPESFIIDAQGIVVWNHRGPLTEEILQKEILPLLPAAQ